MCVVNFHCTCQLLTALHTSQPVKSSVIGWNAPHRSHACRNTKRNMQQCYQNSSNCSNKAVAMGMLNTKQTLNRQLNQRYPPPCPHAHCSVACVMMVTHHSYYAVPSLAEHIKSEYICNLWAIRLRMIMVLHATASASADATRTVCKLC